MSEQNACEHETARQERNRDHQEERLDRDPRCSAWLAATNPSGPARLATVITAVMTFGRRAAGVRTVRIPRIGAFTIGWKKPIPPITIIAACQGSPVASRKIGSGSATTPTAQSLTSSTFCVSCCATTAPASAPTPKPPKRKPRTWAFWS